MANEELNAVIATAEAELRGGTKDKAEPKTEETTEEETVETEETPESEEVEGEEKEETEEEISDREAKYLYQLLKDPKTSREVIKELANNIGLLDKDVPKTQTGEARERKKVQDLLKEGLGTEYGFLADKLGPAIEKIIDQEREERLEESASVERNRVIKESNDALTRLNKETNGHSKKVEAQMQKLASDFAPGPHVTPYNYVKMLYKLATGKNPTSSNASIADKINRNASDATTRIMPSSSRAAAAPKPLDMDKIPKAKRLNAAIESAMVQINKGK